MMVKFFNRGKGGGDSPVNYFLGSDGKREGALVLQGDPKLTAELINSSSFAKRYTSGALSFEEFADDISDEKKALIMANFEKTLMCGLAPDQYNILWIEHSDKEAIQEIGRDGKMVTTKKGRLELNFLIPTTEMRTGRRLQPYYHDADLIRVNAFQNITNYENGFSDPHNPLIARTMNPFESRNSTIEDVLGKKSTQVKEVIDDFLIEKMAEGSIKNRDDVVEQLENFGFEVKRQNDKFISVQIPDRERPMRLHGIFFNKSFNPKYLVNDKQNDEQKVVYDATIQAYKERKYAEYLEKRDENYKHSLKEWETGFELKSREHEARFSKVAGGKDAANYILPPPMDVALHERFKALIETLPNLDAMLAKDADVRQPERAVAVENVATLDDPKQNDSYNLDFGM